MFLAESRNLAVSSEAFLGTRIGQALAGPQFAPLRERLAADGISSPLNPLPTFGVDWTALAATADPCRFVLFLLPDGSTGAALLFPQSGGSTPPQCLALAREGFLSRGYRPAERRQDGVSTTVFTHSTRKDSTRAIVHADQYTALVSSAAAADYLVAAPPDAVLADLIAQADAPPSSPGEILLFVKPWELVRATRAPRAKAGVDDPDEVARRVGWNKLSHLSGSLQFGAAAEPEFRASLDVHAARPFARAMLLLDFLPGPVDRSFANLPAHPGAASLTTFRWDFGEAMQGFATLFDDANEPGLDGVGLFDDLLLGLLEDPEGPQVDLRQDVFAHLGPSVSQLRVAMNDGSLQTLFSIEVRNAAAVREALLRYYAGDDRVAHTRREGFEVWTAPAGNSLLVEGESDSLVTICALALSDDRLAAATHTELMETLLSVEEAAGGAAATWQAATGGEPRSPDASLLGLWNPAQESPASYQEAILFREPAQSLSAKVMRMALVGSADAAEDSPLAAAPPFESFRDALPVISLELETIEAGFRAHLESAPPRPTSAAN